MPHLPHHENFSGILPLTKKVEIISQQTVTSVTFLLHCRHREWIYWRPSASSLPVISMQEPNDQELQKLRHDIDSVQARFFHLLSVTVVVMLVLAVGMVARVFPKLLWHLQNFDWEKNYIPQLLGGLLLLVLLLSWYVIEQRKHLERTQLRLIQELIARETAERMAVIDPLTELYNRRYMTQAITKEVSRADRHDTRLAFLIIDVDDFKQTNDSLGHLAGDNILREVSKLLQRTFRSSDVISRYGGDEFLVLMVDVDDAKTVSAVDRLQKEVETWNHTVNMAGYRMRLSCGTAIYRKGGNPDSVLAAADEAMYRDKQKASAAAASTSA
jgi:diguanylate cyclase (GGDEF)-like protein